MQIIVSANNGNRVTWSDFWIINLLFFESDFNAANSSGAKFKGALFSLQEVNEENGQSLIIVFKSAFFSLGISKLLISWKSISKESK